MEVIVYLPVGTVLYANENTYSFHSNDSHYRDILHHGDEEQYLLIEDGETRCLDCPVREKASWEEDWNDDDNGVYIKDEGIFIEDQDCSISW